MKVEVYFACLAFLLLSLNSFSQKLDKEFVKGLKYDVPPATPLPLEYHTYHIEHHLDSLTPYLTGSPLSKNGFDLFKEDFSEIKPIDTRLWVKQGGDFYISAYAGAFKIRKAQNIQKPKITDATRYGYVKQIEYTLPFKLVFYNKDGSIIREMVLQKDSDVITKNYNPNFNLIYNGPDWNRDGVFESVQELEAKFKEQSKFVYEDIIIKNIRSLMNNDAMLIINDLYNGHKNVSYSPRFYTAKMKGRQFDYSDLDTAYVAYTKAFKKLKINPADKESYKGDFEKVLKICLDAYNDTGARMNFDLKNGMLYNIATIYYHIGNPDEAHKYVALYKVDSWDYISKVSRYYKPAYENQDLHFIIYEFFWGTVKM